MRKLPEARANTDEITQEDSEELIHCIPALLRYMSECVSDTGEDGLVHVHIVSENTKNNIKWAMRLTIPGHHTMELEKLEVSYGHPEPGKIREMLISENIEVPVRSQVSEDIEFLDEK